MSSGEDYVMRRYALPPQLGLVANALRKNLSDTSPEFSTCRDRNLVFKVAGTAVDGLKL